jgi:hypothetical protein
MLCSENFDALGPSSTRQGSSTVSSAASIEDVALMALELAEVTETDSHGNRTWQVAGKGFACVRPLSKADLKRFGDVVAPVGPLAVRVEDGAEKEAVLAANPRAFFTIAHFEGYSAVLIELRKVSKKVLREAILDGWLLCAPPAPAEKSLMP